AARAQGSPAPRRSPAEGTFGSVARSRERARAPLKWSCKRAAVGANFMGLRSEAPHEGLCDNHGHDVWPVTHLFDLAPSGRWTCPIGEVSSVRRAAARHNGGSRVSTGLSAPRAGRPGAAAAENPSSAEAGASGLYSTKRGVSFLQGTCTSPAAGLTSRRMTFWIKSCTSVWS